MMKPTNGFAAALGLLAAFAATSARADKIKHPTAVFSGLDKITGRIISFDVATDETVQFGSLQITPRVCYTRPPTESPQTTGFLEVDEVQSDNSFKRIFSGWMYAASPGLHGVEHPVYDVWLTDCKGGTELVPESAALPNEPAVAASAPPPPPPKPGTVPRPRQQRPAAAASANPPPAYDPLSGPGPLDPQRARGTVAAQPASPPPAQRRSPIQSFFPTVSNPGESQREKDLMR